MKHAGMVFGAWMVYLVFSGPVLLLQAQFQYDNAHLGVAGSASIQNTVSVPWRVKTGGAVRSTGALTSNSLIIGSSDSALYCLNLSDGAIRWKFAADGAIGSSPYVKDGIAYVTTRANTLYAIRATNGTLVWKRSLGAALPYEWGFDYYIGSPTVDRSVVYVGSADGNLYAIDLKSAKDVWKFTASGVVRSTPAVDDRAVYFGDCSGKVFAVDKKSGARLWEFAAVGDTLDNERFGFDRKAMISSPTLYYDKLFVGGRDGYLYALDRSTGKELWRYDYEVSWVISTVAVRDSILVTGTSDGRFIHALDVNTGRQLWRFAAQGPVWASPSISGNDRVVIPGNDGNVYCLELRTGREIWRHTLGPQIFSSAVLRSETAYVGSDDGYITALATRKTDTKPPGAVKRAVFWMKDPIVQPFRSGMDVAIRDYFIRQGYEFVDQTDVADFLRARIASDTASVLVFATNYFHPSIVRDTMGTNLLKLYLSKGGKAVVLGMNPAVYVVDQEKKQVTGLDFSQSENACGVAYRYKDLRSHGGFYPSFVTAEGRRWGLTHGFVAISGMPPADVSTALAIDENGKATAWVKKFSAREGAGFVQLFLTPERLSELPDVQRAAEYGVMR